MEASEQLTSDPSDETIAFLSAAGAPEYLLACLNGLRFQHPSAERLRLLDDHQWQALSDWCDARQLTFLLPDLCGNSLPPQIQERILRSRGRYLERFLRLKQELFEISDALHEAGLEFVLLKGLSHSPHLTLDPITRAQGDIDLWLRGRSVYQASELLAHMGYRALQPAKSRHLPPVARRSRWKWRGDRFDPEMPISVELHYELWSENTEYIAVPGQDEFWDRRQVREFDGHSMNVLCDEDLLGFAALHLLLHVLHGELPLQRAWEIGNFLHHRSRDAIFWDSWRQAHRDPLRQMEALTFQLVHEWFECDLAPVLREEATNLPAAVRSWIEHFSLSPLKREFLANKDELWLHLALVKSWKKQTRVLLRRLFPAGVRTFADRTSGISPAARACQVFRQRGLMMSRLAHHLCTILPTLYQGLRWMRLQKQWATSAKRLPGVLPH